MQYVLSGLKVVFRAIGSICVTAVCAVLFVLAQIVLSGVIYDLPMAVWVCLVTGGACVVMGILYARQRAHLSLVAKRWRWVVLTLLACMAVAAWLRVTTFGPATLALGLGAAPGTFVLFGGFGILFTLVCVWRRAWKTVYVAGTLSCIVMGGALLVLIAQVSYARSEGVVLSGQEVFSAEDVDVRSADTVYEYKQIDGVTLKAGIWRPKAGTIQRDKTIVLIHGGGFAAGSYTDMKNLGSFLSSEGYSAVSIDYRMAPPPRWKDATQDVLDAFAWLQTHRSLIGATSDKIVPVGVSAGGNLALNAAYLASGRGIEGIVGVAGVYPPADLRDIYHATTFQNPQPVITQYVGGSPEQVPGQWQYASPTSHVRADLPPTFLLTGAHDHLVYVSSVESFARRVQASGSMVELHVIPYADHSFDIRYNSPASAIERALLQRWLEKV